MGGLVKIAHFDVPRGLFAILVPGNLAGPRTKVIAQRRFRSPNVLGSKSHQGYCCIWIASGLC
jgi:hypothetical protein